MFVIPLCIIGGILGVSFWASKTMGKYVALAMVVLLIPGHIGNILGAIQYIGIHTTNVQGLQGISQISLSGLIDSAKGGMFQGNFGGLQDLFPSLQGGIPTIQSLIAPNTQGLQY